VNLVDSCGWLEYLTNGPHADVYSVPLTDTGNLVVPSICIAEVCKKVMTLRSEETALEIYTLMTQGHLAPLDSPIALLAARLGREYGLPLADSIILATTRSLNATLWTQDGHFRTIPRVRFIE
jgi:predicted nucleic acid-binding protein